MALSPESLAALDEALTAVIEEAADDPEAAPLVEALTAAQEVMPTGEGAEEAPLEEEEDRYSFEQAEAKHKAARRPAEEVPVDA